MATARLCIDFGTSNTVAVLHQGGQPAPLLFDGSPLLPSAVYLAPGTELLVGRDAERSAGIAPERLEPNPKRRIDDGTVWLGDRELPVAELIAVVLRRVVDEAVRVVGSVPDAVLTYPAGWAGPRMAVLTDAAGRAGLTGARLVPEPVAAASYFVTVLGRGVPVGRCVVVYDLGAGTFDVAVVQRNESGFEVLAASGLPDVGGLDLDSAVVGHLRATASGTAWGRLDWPESAADRRARRLLWADARAVKEQLSRHASAELQVPLVEAAVHLTRDEFEKLARPLLDRTVATTTDTLRAAGVGRESVAGLFLVGGSSRVPLAASLLHRTLGIAPTVLDQPELVVATGAAHAVPAIPAEPAAPAAPAEPAPAASAVAAHPPAVPPVPARPTAPPARVPVPARRPPAGLVLAVQVLAVVASLGYWGLAAEYTVGWFHGDAARFSLYRLAIVVIWALVGPAGWLLTRRGDAGVQRGTGLLAGWGLLALIVLPVGPNLIGPSPLAELGTLLYVVTGVLAAVALARMRPLLGPVRPARPGVFAALLASTLVSAVLYVLSGGNDVLRLVVTAAVSVLLMLAVVAVRRAAVAAGLVTAWFAWALQQEALGLFGPLYWSAAILVLFTVANLAMARAAWVCLRDRSERRVGEGGQRGVHEYPDAVGDG